MHDDREIALSGLEKVSLRCRDCSLGEVLRRNMPARGAATEVEDVMEMEDVTTRKGV
jgi:hypothetical protein